MNFLDSLWLRHRPESLPPAVLPQLLEASPAAVVPAEVRFIARQPIFDRERAVFGYELLARSGWENRFQGESESATRTMIYDSALYGFGSLTRGRRPFINCTRESLLDGLVTLLPRVTVIELLETIVSEPAVLAACRHLKELGYAIALDDFRLTPANEGLIALADYIKVDFRLSDREERREILAAVKGSKAILIAEKIETEEEYKIARDEGFELFQGYFFCRPKVFSARRTSANGSMYLQLFGAVSQPDINFRQVARLVESEATICYQLLQLVNSALYGLSKPVRSVHDALMIVGENQFRKLVLNTIAVETCRKHSDELLIRVLQRSRFCDLMSRYTGEDNEEQYLFGLLSMMGVMLDVPTERAIESMPLRGAVRSALLGEKNSVSRALDLLECYEQGDWTKSLEQAKALCIEESVLTQVYTESLRWAESTSGAPSQANA